VKQPTSQEKNPRNVYKGELFKDAVVALQRAGHRVCVLHGYKGYPDNISSDVDAISADAAQIPRILSESGAATVVQAIHTQPTAALWYVLCRWREGKPVFLRLHVFYEDYRIDGLVFFRGEEFLEKSRPFKFFEVPPPDLEFAAYLVKRAAKGSLDESQGQRLSKLYDADPVGCRRHLARLLPEAEAALVAQAAQSRDWKAACGDMGQLYKEMKDRVGREQPLEVLRNRLDDFRRRVGRVLRPSGLVVAVLGVDGAGKSTVMARVEQDLAPAFWSTKLYHGRALDSPLRWTKRVRQERRERDLIKLELEREAAANPHAVPLSRDPHDKPSRGLALSLVKLGLWWADYTLLGYLADVFPRLRRSTLVLFDRYYHDLLADPIRHRYGGPIWLARFVGRGFPQPHLVILLDAPAEVLYARKQEVSLEETARQRDAYLDVVQKLPNGHVVDASKPIPEVVADAEKIILDHVAARTARRLKL
jgi:thymidylate kinase